MQKHYLPHFILTVFLLSSCYVTERRQTRRLLAATESRQQYESGRLKSINHANDSLQEKGAIYDSVYTVVKNEVKTYELQLVEVDEKLVSLKQKVAVPKTFRKEHKYVFAETKAVHKAVVENAAAKDSFFRSLENRLSESDLSGEKGRLAGMLKDAGKQQEKDAATISNIGNTKDSLLNAGKVDSATSEKLDTRFQDYKRRMDSMSAEINVMTRRLNTPDDFKKNFALIKRKILLIDKVVNQGASSREYVFSMIMESIAHSAPNLFSLAAFFGPGGYVIPADKYELANTYFSPLVDSLIQFSNKYEKVQRIATIVVNGYADGTSIKPGSALYKSLATYLHKKQPEKEELNRTLSYLRAEEISKMLLRIIKQKAPEFKSVVKVTFESVEAGMGETLPDPNKNDYTINDERRRIVIIYWNVMPNE